MCSQGSYMAVAEQMIVHTYFFSATREVLPKAISVPSLPAVVVFKDGTFLTYNGMTHSGLRSVVQCLCLNNPVTTYIRNIFIKDSAQGLVADRHVADCGSIT